MNDSYGTKAIQRTYMDKLLNVRECLGWRYRCGRRTCDQVERQSCRTSNEQVVNALSYAKIGRQRGHQES